MRYFFALNPPAEVRDRMVRLQRDWNLPARAIPARNFHITLAFLGELCEKRFDRARSAASGLVLPAEQLVLDRLGAFPRARVAWVGCGDVPAGLAAFRQALVSSLLDEGLEIDTRPWKPHVTLYRELRTGYENVLFEGIEWPVDSWQLMRSVSGPRGVEYHIKGSWPAEFAGDVRASP